MASSRSQQAALQRAIGALADVHEYRYTVSDWAHPEPGWWATPNVLEDACSCRLCEAARAGRDAHLGCTARIAALRIEQLAAQHAAPVPASVSEY